MRTRLGAVARLAIAAGMLLALTGIVAQPARAAYSVTLTSSTTGAAENESVQFTAQTDRPVEAPYYLQIYNMTTGQRMVACQGERFCIGYAAYPSGTYEFMAYVGSSSSTPPPSNMQGASNPVVVTWSGRAPSGSPSRFCDTAPGQTKITETAVQGVLLKVFSAQTPTDTDLCFRVDAGTLGRGGRINIHTGTPNIGVGTIGTPQTDTNTAACSVTSPPNAVPGTHPMADTTTLGQHVMLDSYANTAVGASVCLTVGTTKIRVFVPINYTGPVVQPNISVTPYLDAA